MLTKRIFDLSVIFIFLPICIPVYLVSMILLWVFQGAPIHYSQPRVGKNGVEFRLYKFRSMISNADEIGSYRTQKYDARITKIGHIFRKLSIDEVPQLVNVIKNDMSLIGPRPYVLKQKAQFTTKDWDARVSIAPGLTGLAQVSGRSDCSTEERLRLDLEYVKKHNLLLDIKILLSTVKVVLQRKGTN